MTIVDVSIPVFVYVGPRALASRDALLLGWHTASR